MASLMEVSPGEMLLAHCQVSAPLEHKGHFPLSLENQFANSIRIRVKLYQKRDPRDRILHVSWAYLPQNRGREQFIYSISC
jgi:hypothetical protein